jgi:hypothetical protein
VERRRNGERRQGPVEPIALGVLDEDPRFEHCLGQFLDEQRVAVGLDHDVFCHFGGQHTPARHPHDHALDVGAVEATERQGADIGETNPGRPELRSEGEQCQDRELTHPLDSQIE